MNQKMAKPPNNPNGSAQPAQPPAVGFGTRAGWPLPPVGEAARRDPHRPDPVPNVGAPASQRTASPPVATKRGVGVGDGIEYNGMPPHLVYVKRLGTMLQRALAVNYLSGVFESRWRVGGVGYPPDDGYGPGYHGDAATLWPGNPQIYLRNPGIQPLTNMPQTYRYAAMQPSIQPLGPSIADVGNMLPAANASPDTRVVSLLQ